MTITSVLNKIKVLVEKIRINAYAIGYEMGWFDGDATGYQRARREMHDSSFEAFQRGLSPRQWAAAELERDIANSDPTFSWGDKDDKGDGHDGHTK